MKVKGQTLTENSFVSIRSEFISTYGDKRPIDGQRFYIRRVTTSRKYKHAGDVLDSHVKRQQQSLVYFNEKIIGAVFRDVVDGVWKKYLAPLDFKGNKVFSIIR